MKPRFIDVAAREIFYRGNDESDDLFAICEGWAIVYHRLRDGRRYIVHFLIPGDFAGLVGVFRNSGRYSFQALTQLRIGAYKRSELRPRIRKEAGMLTAWHESALVLYRQVAKSAWEMALATADQRVASLLVDLRDRLHVRGLVNQESFAFPLRQSHIADAVGLTTVHVNRVLSSLRAAKLLAIEGGTLTILDLPKLRRLAEMN